ncbi:MAG: hypothetical protein JOZ93_14565 [Sinobacteraceae bacterium]|nr:hypothetical protein [Nevskiaceae bacterium]
MTTKKKNQSEAAPAEPNEVVSAISLYVEESARHRELLQAARELQDAGRLDEADEVMRQAEVLLKQATEIVRRQGKTRH